MAEKLLAESNAIKLKYFSELYWRKDFHSFVFFALASIIFQSYNFEIERIPLNAHE